jgi:hypothetical protein
MQLSRPTGADPLRARIAASAWALIAGGLPRLLHADPENPTWQFDGSGLYYSEKDRATVVEPVARITRLFTGGRQLSAGLALDAITGASPSGALPNGETHTVTSASGTTSSSPAGEIPTTSFHDFRTALDAGYVQPVGTLFSSTTGATVSHEKDYQSLGISEKVSLDVLHRLATITVGGSVDHDAVFPVGGTPVGLSDGTVLLTTGHNPKHVTTLMAGISRVVTRRLLLAVTATGIRENGYLTEPYKVLSVLDPVTGVPVSQLTENRPDTRRRTALLGSGVYHLADDVIYGSYRYYWDDWGIRSHTVDLRYHVELPEHDYVVPHIRFYTQNAADFFRYALVQGDPLPLYASSDLRVGALRTLTLGATYGFHLVDTPGDLTARAEYLRQWGDGHPPNAIGIQQEFDLAPGVNIVTVMVGYSVRF